MKVRCCNLFSGDEITTLNRDVNAALAFWSREGILWSKQSTVFPGMVTLFAKVTVVLRERSERVGGCKVGVCAASMRCLEIVLLVNRTLQSKELMQDLVGCVVGMRGNSIRTLKYGKWV